MTNIVNFKHLHYFWVVAHQGSIAKASQMLNITPQTISGQLSLLEERFGNPLFEKEGRGLKLSDTGKLVLSYADDIFELGNELSNVLRGESINGPTKLIVSSASGLPKTIVYKIIEPALRLPNPLNLVSLEGPIKSILADLAIHKVDLVLSDTPATTTLNSNVYNHFLGEAGLTFFAADALLEKHGKNFPASLDDAPLLLPTPQYEVRQLVDRWLSQKNITPRICGEFDDSALMKSFGKAGLGIFFMPSTIEEEVCRDFDVTIIGRTDEVKQKFYAISAERRVKNPAITAIFDSARQALFYTE
jgi:LysR family transcriptional activator of nhaA